MLVKVSVRKTLEENAAGYFEAAKKAKKKLDGAKAAIVRAKNSAREAEESKPQVVSRKKEWFEKFRWTYSADGVLIIAGKDADSNEVIIKKHAEPADTVFHTEAPGSPFALVKGAASEQTAQAAALLVACYSKAWKQGHATADVFSISASQVSKTPNTGESISKGSFIVRGEKTYFHPKLELHLGVIEGRATAGLQALFTKHATPFITLKPGTEKTSEIAKKLTKRFGFAADQWNPLIPAGGVTITTHKNTLGEEKKR